MQLRFSENQAQWLAPVWNVWIQQYLKVRYGRSWQWYWLNWEYNHELLI
jgi:hypothetical protein